MSTSTAGVNPESDEPPEDCSSEVETSVSSVLIWSQLQILTCCFRSCSACCSGLTCAVCLLSVKSVHQQDAGQYWCEVELHGQTLSSDPAWITVEGGTLNWACAFLDLQSDLHSSGSAGVPHFIQEPQDVSVFPDVAFNLTCAAVGPPGPVEVLWWLGGVQVGRPRPSPSVLPVAGQGTIRCPSALGKSLSESSQHSDVTMSHTHTHSPYHLLRCIGGGGVVLVFRTSQNVI